MSHRCIVVRPGQDPVVEAIGDDLKDWQAVVGGDIEGWGFDPPIMVICNDNRVGLPPNRRSPRLGTIHGTFFLAKSDDEGENTDLTDADIKLCIEELQSWPAFELRQTN